MVSYIAAKMVSLYLNALPQFKHRQKMLFLDGCHTNIAVTSNEPE